MQPCIPSGHVDEYMAETIRRFDNDDYISKDNETEVAASPTSLKQAEEDLLGKSMVHVKPIQTEGEHRDGDRQSNECPNAVFEKFNTLVNLGSSLGPASGAQHCELLMSHVATDSSFPMSKENEHDSADFDKERSTSLGYYRLEDAKLQNAEGDQQDECDCTHQLLRESLQITQVYENCDGSLGAISNGSVDNRIPHDLEEASQHLRGMPRRCLQFEAPEAQRNTIGNSCSSWNSTEVVTNSRLPASPIDLEILDPSHVESSATSTSRQLVNWPQPITSSFDLTPVKTTEACVDLVGRSVRNSGNSSISTSMSSGIGLHLNSIVKGVPIGSGITASLKLAKYPCVSGENSVSAMSGRLPKDSKISDNLVEKFSANVDDDELESYATVAATSATFHSPHSMKLPNNSVQLKLIENHTIPCDKRKSDSENTDTFEEFNQLSPKKKRKRASYTIENDGCKRCNCKRSKCLKLYCECFAAGLYCAETCACQECYNKLEYEDTVSGTRQQIESRNPLAFAPKIEDGNRMTPSSARHKRGCNCKKSMCLKKYCECYQANVGCSEGCRCDGCKNIFGVKSGYGEITEMVYKRANDERQEDVSGEKLGMVETRSDFLHLEHCHSQNLTPLTPSFQCSNHGKDVPKSLLPAQRYLLSPETEVSVLYGKSISPKKMNIHDRQLNMSKEILDIGYDQELDCGKAWRVDEFLPRWDGLSDICHLTPLPHPPSRAMSSSVSSSTSDYGEVSRAQLCQGSDCQSSIGSLRWRNSPITSMPCLSGSKYPQEPDSEGGLYDIVEDNTPEILKETPSIKAVKATSPNQKRVAPPHSRLQEVRSSSSLGLRSGRKFILQAVPSFPPLTPYSDLKGNMDKRKGERKD